MSDERKPPRKKENVMSSARNAVGKLWLSMTFVQSRLLLIQVLAYLVVVGAIITWYNKFEPFYDQHPTLSVLLILAPLLYIICFYVAPQQWRRRREAQRDAIRLSPQHEV